MMNSQSHFRALSVAFIALALVTRSASAQTADLERETARAQYRNALDAADRNDWAEARRLYLELWNKSRSYDVASGIGLAEFRLGRHALGARFMARALDDMPLKEKTEVRQRLEAMLTEMKKAVAVVHLSVSQDSAEIRADGEVLGTSPSVKDVYLEPGTRSLEAVLGRAPTDAEMAEALEMSESELQAVFTQVSFVGVVALDDMFPRASERGETTTLADTIADKGDGPMGQYEVEEVRQGLAAAINRMPEREKVVLTLYYYENLTLAEIGQVLGVTESRVCQIHTRAVLQLRSRLSVPS